MKRYDMAVIGGGAAGIVAAISAKRRGRSVILCEKMPRLGKKILASGGGRCNLANERLDESFYNPAARPLVRSIFARFGKEKILGFFDELGLKVYADGGRIFPVTNQASSVLAVLERELERAAVPVELSCDVTGVTSAAGGFIITTRGGRKISCAQLVLAGGGRSYPALGSDGKAYHFAQQFGHTVIEPIPSAVPLLVKDRLCHLLQGQRIAARVNGIVDGAVVSEASGELLFTNYGLSGTAVIDASAPLSAAIHRDGKRDVALHVDMVPFMSEKELRAAVAKRSSLAGILPNKCDTAFKDRLDRGDAISLATELKKRRFAVLGTRGWNEAEFTAGGIAVSEVTEGTLESRRVGGLFFAGEILDVDGARGGYNLAWAWSSGSVAGSAE